MLSRTRAMLRANRAIRAYKRSDFRSAWQEFHTAERLFGPEEDTPQSRLDLGKLHQLGAEIHLAEGNLDAALESYGEAESRLAVDRANRQDYGRCMYDAATTLLDLGVGAELAEHWLERAEGALRDTSSEILEAIIVLRATMREPEIEDFEEAVAGLDAAIARVTSRDLRRNLRHRRAVLMLQYGTSAEAATAVDELLDIVEREMARANASDLTTAMSPLALLAERDDVPVPHRALLMAELAMNAAASTSQLDVIAIAHVVRCVMRSRHGDTNGALTDALRAVAHMSAHSWQLSTSVTRHFASQYGQTARHVALLLAHELGDTELVAELIETSRLQCLPSLERESVPPESDTWMATITSAGRRSLQPLRPVTVGGRSRLAEHYPKGLPLGPPINLELIASAVGGPDYWWAGISLGVGGSLFWTLRDEEGRLTSGFIRFTSGQVRALETMLESLPGNGQENLLNCPLTRSLSTESKLSTEVGMAILPPRLRDEIARRAASRLRNVDQPLSLVVLGNDLARFPFAALGVQRTDLGDSIRVIEGATIRWSPPAVVLDRALSHPIPAGPPYPLELACLNPTGDLYWADLPLAAHLVLGGSLSAASESRIGASVDTIVNALRRLGASTRATFVYAGHADEGFVTGDIEAGLKLADGVLRADAVFTIEPDGSPAVPFPARVLISACGSAGSGGAGGGEWLGLGAAILFAGARQVIATSWPIWDSELTAKCDLELADSLVEDTDVAAGVRRVQLRRLAEWRTSEFDLADQAIPFLPDGHAVPVVWAAYQALGLAR